MDQKLLSDLDLEGPRVTSDPTSEAIRGQKIVLEAVRGCGLNPTSEAV